MWSAKWYSICASVQESTMYIEHSLLTICRYLNYLKKTKNKFRANRKFTNWSNVKFCAMHGNFAYKWTLFLGLKGSHSHKNVKLMNHFKSEMCKWSITVKTLNIPYIYLTTHVNLRNNFLCMDMNNCSVQSGQTHNASSRHMHQDVAKTRNSPYSIMCKWMWLYMDIELLHTFAFYIYSTYVNVHCICKICHLLMIALSSSYQIQNDAWHISI